MSHHRRPCCLPRRRDDPSARARLHQSRANRRRAEQPCGLRKQTSSLPTAIRPRRARGRMAAQPRPHRLSLALRGFLAMPIPPRLPSPSRPLQRSPTRHFLETDPSADRCSSSLSVPPPPPRRPHRRTPPPEGQPPALHPPCPIESPTPPPPRC